MRKCATCGSVLQVRWEPSQAVFMARCLTCKSAAAIDLTDPKQAKPPTERLKPPTEPMTPVPNG